MQGIVYSYDIFCIFLFFYIGKSINSNCSTDINKMPSKYSFWRQDRTNSNTSLHNNSVYSANSLIRKKKEKTSERRSRFFVAVLLILTFLLFIIVPDLVYLLYGIIEHHDTTDTLALVWVFFGLGNLSDALIYTFMYRPVKTLFWKKINAICGCCCCGARGGVNVVSNMITSRTPTDSSLQTTKMLRNISRESDV